MTPTSRCPPWRTCIPGRRGPIAPRWICADSSPVSCAWPGCGRGRRVRHPEPLPTFLTRGVTVGKPQSRFADSIRTGISADHFMRRGVRLAPLAAGLPAPVRAASSPPTATGPAARPPPDPNPPPTSSAIPPDSNNSPPGAPNSVPATTTQPSDPGPNKIPSQAPSRTPLRSTGTRMLEMTHTQHRPKRHSQLRY